MAEPVSGLRCEKLSVEYKKAIQWALVRSGCSQRAFPMVHATLVYFTMKEMGLKPALNDVLTFVPTNLGSILDYCADMDDHAMAEEATHIQAAFALSDMGDQKAGTGKNSITHNGATGYDHSTNSVWGAKHMSGMDVGKDGGSIAKSIMQDGKRWGIQSWRGSVTDSAANCIRGMVGALQAACPGFVAMACFLHVMNLVLVNSYLSSFGDEERGVCSALRIGYMMSYLHHKFPDEWRGWCADNGHGDISYIAAGAAKTRWWSVTAAFGDCYKNRVAYQGWCTHMTVVHKGGYNSCFTEMAAWLQNNKALCDMSLIFGFCTTWWNQEMEWLQGVGHWQAHLPLAAQKAGYRANEMPWRVILERRKLQELEPPSAANLPGYTMDPRWSEYAKNRAGLTEGEREQMDEEVANFLNTALDVHGRHSIRWLTTLVDCSLAHHNSDLALACAAALLAIYDGETLPVVPAASAKQTIDGEVVDLNEVVPLIVQFADAETLHESSVIFPDEAAVADIREWVAAGELRDEWGLRLQTQFKSLILGRPIHSHWAERAVNAASSIVQKCGAHEREDRLSDKVSFIINEMRVLMREAAHETEAERAASGGGRVWVLDARKIRRQQRPSHGGKRLMGLVIRKIETKAAKMTPSFQAEATKQAAKRKAARMDRRSHAAKRVEEKLGNQQKTADKRKLDDAASSAVALAAKSNPRKVALNQLDLSSPTAAPTVAVLAMECECRDLGEKVKRSGARAKVPGEVTSSKADLISVLVSHHKGATTVPKMTSYDGSKKSKSFVGDSGSAATRLQETYNKHNSAPHATTDESDPPPAPPVATGTRTSTRTNTRANSNSNSG